MHEKCFTRVMCWHNSSHATGIHKLQSSHIRGRCCTQVVWVLGATGRLCGCVTHTDCTVNYLWEPSFALRGKLEALTYSSFERCYSLLWICASVCACRLTRHHKDSKAGLEATCPLSSGFFKKPSSRQEGGRGHIWTERRAKQQPRFQTLGRKKLSHLSAVTESTLAPRGR